MIRVDASRNETEMVQRKSLRPVECDVSVSMGQSPIGGAFSKHAVPPLVNGARPYPTRAKIGSFLWERALLINSFPEALRRSDNDQFGRAMFEPAPNVHGAVAITPVWAPAVINRAEFRWPWGMGRQLSDGDVGLQVSGSSEPLAMRSADRMLVHEPPTARDRADVAAREKSSGNRVTRCGAHRLLFYHNKRVRLAMPAGLGV
jgi:hypothetical protein